jgi:hypothetical protein
MERCEICGGNIVRQMAFGPYPERLYCVACGREPGSRERNMMEEDKKICRKCRKEKSISEFGVLNSSKDGHSPVCFECRRKKTLKTSDKRGPGRPPKPVAVSTIVKEEPMEELFRNFKNLIIENFVKEKLIPLVEGLLNGRHRS